MLHLVLGRAQLASQDIRVPVHMGCGIQSSQCRVESGVFWHGILSVRAGRKAYKVRPGKKGKLGWRWPAPQILPLFRC